MNKQEAIKQAYGEHWETVKDYVDENGWINSYNLTKEIKDFCLDIKKIDITTGWAWAHRPKSLQGIEDNNGWVKIESEKDLPNEQVQCFVISNNKIKIGTYIKRYKKWICDGQYYAEPHENLKLTHYKPIEKPKPPIY